MKKTLGIFSLAVLLFSTLAPSFTYANNDVEILERLLQNAIDEEDAKLNNNLLNNNLEQNNEDQVTLLGNTDENPYIVYDENNGLITVYSKDYSYGITIKDKNYGASNIGGYGTAYNWGNNTNTPNTSIIDDNNAWGGGSDVASLWGYDSTSRKAINVEGRKGICPNNYHIPSIGEWSELINLYYQSKGLENNLTSSNYLKKNNQDTEKLFLTDLKLPLGGINCYRSTDVGSKGYYRSSSKQSNDNKYNARYLEITSAGIVDSTKSYGRGCKMSIRCFKNDYIQKTFTIRFVEKDTNNLLTGEITAIAGKKISENLLPIVPEGTIYDYYEGNEKINNIKTYTVNSDTTIEVGFKCKPRYVKNDELNRCIRRPEGDTVTIIYHPNGGAFSGMEINQTTGIIYDFDGDDVIPIYNIQIPDRKAIVDEGWSGWMFAGWYTKSGESNDWGEEFDPYMLNASIAYAKWLPFNDLDLSEIGLTGVKIMDRNLGAEAIAIGIHKNDNNDQSEDNEKLGLYYQWGNNYGFKNIKSSIKIGNDLISNTENTIKPRGPNNYFYNNLFVGVTRIPYRWNLEENFNLWGGENNRNSDLDKKGPCPQGYHIPDIQEWNAIYNKLQTNQSTICEGNTSELWKCFAKKLKLPFAGTLNSNNGNIAGKGNYGNYWSANPYSIDNSYHISFGTYTNIQDQSTNASGKPIRCFKNNVYFNKLKLNIGNDEENKTFKLRRWETIGAYLSNIEKKGFELLGWYDDNLYINETDTKNTINSDKSIFAKREKNPRYTFNGNGGKFNDGKEEIEIKYLIKREEYNKSTNSSYGSFTIEGAKALNVTLNKTDDYGTYHEVCIYNHIKTDTTQGEDCIIRGKAGEINNVHINGDTVGFVIRQNGPQIAAEFNIVADNGYETDDNVGEPSNSGYTFSGWYETGATDPFDFTGTEVTKDRTFYAKWNPHHYTIQFDINEGTGTAEDINATYGKEIQLPTVTREGYTFKGWKSEDGIIYNNTIPEGTGVTTEDGVTVTLTAQWELIPVITPSAGGGQSITPAKQETKVTEQEHNSADNEDQKVINTQNNTPTGDTVATEEIKQKVKKVEDKSLTRGEVAIMTNILLEVYPQLVEGKQELDDITNACSNYADEQNFTKDEKKAITRLCKLSIMGIHADDNKPLEEFLVNDKSTNDEFSKIINRSLSTYTEKDFSVVKNALKKLEGDEDNIVFGTVYEVFMSIKNIFN